jgi:CBS domain-containing protein
MEKYNVRHLPVVLENNEIVGMLSEHGLHLAHFYRYPESLRVFDLMKEHPHCVSTESYAAEALRLMSDFKVEAFAVTTGRRLLEGIFTRHDALKLLGKKLIKRDQLLLAA